MYCWSMLSTAQNKVQHGWAKRGNELFNQDYDRTDEIFVKMTEKIPRPLFISFLANELKVPRKCIYGVVAKRGGGFVVTVSERNCIPTLCERLTSSKKVNYVKRYEKDVFDVRVEEVPPKFPDVPIRSVLQQHGEILSNTTFQNGNTIFLRDFASTNLKLKTWKINQFRIKYM